MKDFLRLSLLNAFSLFTVASFFPGLVVSTNLIDLFWAGVTFTLINHLIKPIIKLFLLPINLVTLGLFRWLANVLVLLILTKLVSTISITAFKSPLFARSGLVIPSINVQPLMAYILASFFLSLIFNLFHSIIVAE